MLCFVMLGLRPATFLPCQLLLVGSPNRGQAGGKRSDLLLPSIVCSGQGHPSNTSASWQWLVVPVSGFIHIPLEPASLCLHKCQALPTRRSELQPRGGLSSKALGSDTPISTLCLPAPGRVSASCSQHLCVV